ncbi:MAG: S8 family serine peptidase [Jiangellaceae bacterium]
MTVSATASITLVASMVLVTSTGAQAAPERSDKIRPELAESLASKGEASFWIRFRDRADLRDASQVADWAERGTAVAAALKKTAAASQGGAVADLERAGQDHQAFWVTNAIFVRDGSEALAAQMAARPEVEGLYAPTPYELIEPTPGEPRHAPNALEWNIANVNADDVWTEFGVRGDGITVASIDTGTQFDHPALVDTYRGNLGGGNFDHDYNWFDAAGTCPDAPCDTNGHGSHTMGTMVGDDGGENQIGMAPEANWITANGCCPSDAALIASGEWFLEPTDLEGESPDAGKRPHIINNSWGSTSPSTDPFMEDVLIAWDASGIFGMWANGNSGGLGCMSSGSPGSRIINYSAGSYDINNVISPSSGRGPGQDGEIKPNIAAPGVNVRSSVPGGGYANFSGTSMASPHVAGAIPAVVGRTRSDRGQRRHQGAARRLRHRHREPAMWWHGRRQQRLRQGPAGCAGVAAERTDR